jgi:dihydrofolate reductase
MGRKTYDSIGKPLPGRQNIVVTRDANYRREGVTVVHDPGDALRAAGGAPEIMVIGGAELFRAYLPAAARIHLTRVHGDIAGDVHWPALDPAKWRLGGSEPHPADERHAYAMTFEVWERR